jgi:sugar diacid utilization regulator
MTLLKNLLEQARAKTNDSSEAKLLAEFIQDLLNDNGNDPALVASSMCVIIDWATDFKRAAELGTFDAFKENT